MVRGDVLKVGKMPMRTADGVTIDAVLAFLSEVISGVVQSKGNSQPGKGPSSIFRS